MTCVYSELITRNLDNDRFVQLTSSFKVELDTLVKYNLKSTIEIPSGFVMDFESVPIVRGRNKRGGAVHDYLSCTDSDPIVTKQIAAECYLEINSYCDSIDCDRNILIRSNDFIRRWTKWSVVRVWPNYFHKRSVYATPKEIAGIDCDPYITNEIVK
jgi:hypothetical protein